MNKLFYVLAAGLPLCCAAADSNTIAVKVKPEGKAGITNTAVDTTMVKLDETFVREGVSSVSRGANYLLSRQLPDGSWGFQNQGRAIGHPAITALCCMAIYRSGNALEEKEKTEAVNRGRAFILKHVQKDGSIWLSGKRQEYPTYTTAIVLTFLADLGRKEDEEVMRAARKFLMGLQVDENNKDCPADKNDPKYGGVGYGPGKEGAGHVDLSNTQWVAEALYVSDYLDREPNAKSPEDTKKADLAWDKLSQFLTKMQHLPATNQAVWVVTDQNDTNYGGFIYRTEDSDGDEDMKTGQKQTLRSYGSMTYAGLKSMLYAKLEPGDPRVKAATEWAAKHYTLDENPGVGASGHYYYLQTFAKAHSALRQEKVTTANGKVRSWRTDLIRKLLDLQKGNGQWVNEKTGRWMESSPELVTAYSLISLELALGRELNRK